MKELRVIFQCGALSLEGAVSRPEQAGVFPAVIACHPHPLYGGNMDNNVIYSICQAFNQASIISFRFNFRGVEKSEGSFDQGIGEQEDVKSAISFLAGLEQVDSSRLGLVGYSAGAVFGLSVGANDTRIKALAAISPPLTMAGFEYLGDCLKPKLMILGSEDHLTVASRFKQFCEKLAEPRECHIIKGADHFWWGYESIVANKVTDFFVKLFK